MSPYAPPVLWSAGHLNGPSCEGQVVLDVDLNLDSQLSTQEVHAYRACYKASVFLRKSSYTNQSSSLTVIFNFWAVSEQKMRSGEWAMVEIFKQALSPPTSGFFSTGANGPPPQHAPELIGKCLNILLKTVFSKKARRCVICFGVLQNVVNIPVFIAQPHLSEKGSYVAGFVH